MYPLGCVYENGARHGLGMRLLDPCRSLAFGMTHEAVFAGWESGRVTVHRLPDLSIHGAPTSSTTGMCRAW